MQNPVKRIAALHDISAFSRVSLTAVIPILSSMGMQVVPLPTALLSTHGQYPGFRKYDLTGPMQDIISHWKELEISFDAMYSGYLASEEQIAIIAQFFESFAHTGQLVVVDPVLGDNGKLYSSVHPGMVAGMRKLIRHAGLITPNLTEVSLLLGKAYQTDWSSSEVKTRLVELSALGPNIVVITSLPVPGRPDQTGVAAYDRTSGKAWMVSCEYLPAEYPGTGDAFTSVLLGALMQGDSLPIALDRAVNFVSLAIRATFGYGMDPREGILIERVLRNLDGPVQPSTYEVLE